jgi:serine protease Do
MNIRSICVPPVISRLVGFFWLVCCPVMWADSDLADLWAERVRSVVAIEFVIERELDRPVRQTFGVVVNAEGLVIFPRQVMDANLAPEQFTDFRVYLPGKSISHNYRAHYLGHDELTGWGFLQIDDNEVLALLKPLNQFAVSATPAVTQLIWGIGLRKKEEDFAPYFMESRVSIIQRLPQHTALGSNVVSGPGLPVFDQSGGFVGLGLGGFGQTYLQFSDRDRGGLPVVMINPDDCAAVMLADEVVPNWDRIPGNLHGRPLVWLGSNGLQPLDPEVALYLRLDDSPGLVVNEVLAGSPAAAAGLQARDIIMSIDGKPLPSLKPDRVLVTYFEREVDRRHPGDVMRLGVLRGATFLNLSIILTDAPELPSEAARRFFPDLGMTVRGFTYVDGVARQVGGDGQSGVVVTFLKQNSTLATAGLRTNDWITEIDGLAIADYATAIAILTELEANESKAECIFAVRRGTETIKLKIKLHQN